LSALRRLYDGGVIDRREYDAERVEPLKRFQLLVTNGVRNDH
jgi:hypothetical protein